MFLKIRSNQKGIALVLVLIICSIIGAASLYLMDLNKVTTQKLALDAKVQSYRSVVKIVQNAIHSGKTCTQLLGGINIDNAFRPEGQSITLNLNLPMNRKPLKAPVGKDVWYLNGGTSIRDVELMIKDRVRGPVKLAAAGSPSWTAALGYILIVPGHPGVGIKLMRGRQYRIPIFLYYSGSDAGATGKKLVSCGDPAGEAYFCTLSGGSYDETETLSDYKCNPDRKCMAYKAGIVSSPGLCPPRYTDQQIGFYGSNLYLCNWCNQNLIQAEYTPSPARYFDPFPRNPYEASINIPQEPMLPDMVSP